eukprot:CAMPEP_0115235522 /NCGR_PEP_ID=MMETSP0270-20121206/35361_1 /TAXON_ID=71861 /ORGANISM="Scrippsiella trochoidea, Strain CCMP3099" /LENGTH=125 /DNA_ID=CAMNT_0002650321 /DNA_START=123 /DNA_END=501 /DNA_ORIENTATION=+
MSDDAFHDLPRSSLQGHAVLKVEVTTRLRVEDTERACVLVWPDDQGYSGIEHDARIANHKRMISHAIDLSGIRDDDRQVAGDVMAEELEAQTKLAIAPFQAEVRAIPCKRAHAGTTLQCQNAAPE